MENKNNKGLVILVIILTLLVIGLCTFILYEKIKKAYDEKEIKEVTKKKESILINEDKEMVYDDDSYTYLKVPYINLKTDDGKRLNKEIKDFVKDYEDTKEFTENYTINYNTYKYNNVLAVIIEKRTPSSSTKYFKAINLNIKTGKQLSNKDILRIRSIGESDFLSKVFSTYEEIIKNDGSIDVTKDMEVYSMPGTTVYDANKQSINNTKLDDYEMYLNSKGEIVLAIKLYFIAGPESGTMLFNLDTKTYEK